MIYIGARLLLKMFPGTTGLGTLNYIDAQELLVLTLFLVGRILPVLSNRVDVYDADVRDFGIADSFLFLRYFIHFGVLYR